MLTRRRTRLGVLAAALALPLSLLAATPASAATFDVDTWGDLTAAVAAAVSNDTVVVTADITAPSGGQLVISSPKAITLDLNGFALSITAPPDDRAAIEVPPGASLTIDDSAGGGSLTAFGGAFGAAIGGGRGGDAGAVTINGEPSMRWAASGVQGSAAAAKETLAR